LTDENDRVLTSSGSHHYRAGLSLFLVEERFQGSDGIEADIFVVSPRDGCPNNPV
jgi:hypothetical protein